MNGSAPEWGWSPAQLDLAGLWAGMVGQFYSPAINSPKKVNSRVLKLNLNVSLCYRRSEGYLENVKFWIRI